MNNLVLYNIKKIETYGHGPRPGGPRPGGPHGPRPGGPHGPRPGGPRPGGPHGPRHNTIDVIGNEKQLIKQLVKS